MTFPAASRPQALLGQLAFSTGTAPLEDSFAFAAAHGLRWLEFACQEPANQPQEFTPERVRGIRALGDAHGIRGVVHSASSVNAAEIVPGVQRAVQDYLHTYIRLAHDLGSPTVIVHAGFEFDLDIDLRLARLQETLVSCIRVAEPLGITLSLENMNVLPPSAEIRYLGCTADEVAAIIDGIGSDALTSCVDVGHANLLPGGPAAFIRRFAGRISHVQLTDNNGVADEHLAVGRGTLDAAGILSALDEACYTGPIAIELADRDAQVESIGHLLGAATPAK